MHPESLGSKGFMFLSFLVSLLGHWWGLMVPPWAVKPYMVDTSMALMLGFNSYIWTTSSS